MLIKLWISSSKGKRSLTKMIWFAILDSQLLAGIWLELQIDPFYLMYSWKDILEVYSKNWRLFFLTGHFKSQPKFAGLRQIFKWLSRILCRFCWYCFKDYRFCKFSLDFSYYLNSKSIRYSSESLQSVGRADGETQSWHSRYLNIKNLTMNRNSHRAKILTNEWVFIRSHTEFLGIVGP